ncbi:MAG: AhpC/TSA family protein [Gelidibacter sp.]|nr:AhpC/TSA family protein [Gelidibacter sp.]
MKKIVTILMIAVVAVACKQPEPKKNGYVISGTAKGVYDGVRAYLKTSDERGRDVYQDTAIVFNEKFTFKGTIDVPEMWYLAINSVPGKFPIIVENDNITIEVNKSNIYDSKVSGTKANDALAEYDKLTAKLTEKRNAFNSKNRDIVRSDDSDAKAKFSAESEKINKEMLDLPYNFINTHKDNYFSLTLIESLIDSKVTDLNRLESSYKSLDSDLLSTNYGKMVGGKIAMKKQEIERKGNLDIGKVAPDFSGPNPDGKTISLNDIKGKVTIIDFWASWCRPCRMENPNVVKVYNKYHDKGLEIVSVSLDKPGKKDKWLKAIDDDHLTWNHISNLNYFNDPIAKLYDIKSIPSTYILDADGKIVAKSLRGQMLEDKIAEMLN